jgi:hypothetical protein
MAGGMRDLMSTPLQPVPNESSALTAPTASNRLALTSFYLSLGSLAVFVLWFILLSVRAVPLIALVLLLGGLVTSTAGFITGILALTAGDRYPPRQARKGFAIAGLVLGIVYWCGLLGFFALIALSTL